MKKVLKFLLSKLLILVGLHLISLLQYHFKENFSARDFEFPLEQGQDIEIAESSVAQKDLVSNENEVDPGALPPSEKELQQNCQNLTTEDPFVRDILKKKFYYMSMGQHMTVFMDSNKQYVLKLFNPMEPLREEWYQEAKNWKAFSHPKKIYEDWLEKHNRVEAKISEVEQEIQSVTTNPSKIIYLHKNLNKELPQTVSIVDKYGYEQTLDLNKTPFLIQKYAVPLKARVKALASQGKRKELDALKKKFEKFFIEQAGLCIEEYLKDLTEDFGLSFDDLPMQIGNAGKNTRKLAKNKDQTKEGDSYLTKAMQIISNLIDDALETEGPKQLEEKQVNTVQVVNPDESEKAPPQEEQHLTPIPTSSTEQQLDPTPTAPTASPLSE